MALLPFTRCIAFALPAASLALLPGCLGLGKQTPQTRYYVLTNSPPASQPSPKSPPGASYVEPLRLRVDIPRYLDRPQIVTGAASGQIVLGDFDRWAEPLDAGLERVLAANLGARIAKVQVERETLSSAGAASHSLRVVLLALDGAPGESAALSARWSFWSGDKELGGGHWSGEEPAAEEGYAGLARAWSRALGTLSDAIAASFDAASEPVPNASS